MLVVLTVREGDPRGRANSVAAAADDSSVHRIGLSALNVASVAALRGASAALGAVRVAVLHLFSFPFGTALGVYAFWVLLSAQSAPVFEKTAV